MLKRQNPCASSISGDKPVRIPPAPFLRRERDHGRSGRPDSPTALASAGQFFQRRTPLPQEPFPRRIGLRERSIVCSFPVRQNFRGAGCTIFDQKTATVHGECFVSLVKERKNDRWKLCCTHCRGQ